MVVVPVKPTSSHILPTSFPMAEKKIGNRQIDLREQDGVVELTGGSSLFPFYSMVELG
jgi:hypothetical protein